MSLIPTEKECKLVLKMWREEGKPIKIIAENIEVSQQTIIRWLKGGKISYRNRVNFGRYGAEMQRAKNQMIPLIL